jgi:hypothetical protein
MGADDATLKEISTACARWADHPDSYAAMIMVEVIARNE